MIRSAINASNVNQLHLSWHYTTHDYVTGEPLVMDQMVYGYDWQGYLYFLDLNSGKLLYSRQLYKPAQSSKFISRIPLLSNYLGEPLPYLWNGFAGSGCIVGNSLYLGSVGSKPGKPLQNGSAGEFFIINRHDGKTLFREKMVLTPYSGNLSALIADDKFIYIGVSSCEEIVEVVSKLLFKPFHPMSVGHVIAYEQESGKRQWAQRTIGLLPNDPPNAKGASVWGGFAIDSLHHLLFFGTGNNYGEPTSQSSDSFIALNSMNGELKWQYQVTKGDGWLPLKRKGPDYDFGGTPTLFSVVQNGHTIPAVGIGNKNGYFYTFNRLEGTLLWETNCNVNSESDDGIRSRASFHEQRLYIWSKNKKPKNTLTACCLDANTGEVIWSHILKGTNAMSNGALINDLYLIPTYSGQLYALSIKDGKLLWTGEIPGASIGSNITVTPHQLLMGVGVPALYGGNPKQYGIYTFSL